MSVTGYDLKADRHNQLQLVVKNRDIELAHVLAGHMMKEGLEPEAHSLRMRAIKWESEDWDYDNYIGN